MSLDFSIRSDKATSLRIPVSWDNGVTYEFHLGATSNMLPLRLILFPQDLTSGLDSVTVNIGIELLATFRDTFYQLIARYPNGTRAVFQNGSISMEEIPPVVAVGPQGPQGIPGPMGPRGQDGISIGDGGGVTPEQLASTVQAHIISTQPHPVYDDLPSLTLLFENGLM